MKLVYRDEQGVTNFEYTHNVSLTIETNTKTNTWTATDPITGEERVESSTTTTTFARLTVDTGTSKHEYDLAKEDVDRAGFMEKFFQACKKENLRQLVIDTVDWVIEYKLFT